MNVKVLKDILDYTVFIIFSRLVVKCIKEKKRSQVSHLKQDKTDCKCKIHNSVVELFHFLREKII